MSKFITFEGTEGVGKSTQIQLLKEYLQTINIDAIVTHEPGGTNVGERIREILLDQNTTHINHMSELLLMFAARAQHLEEIIRPALQKNIWVLCDRFTDASYAYQGGGRGVPLLQIQEIETLVQGSLRPNLTILLTCNIKTSMKRIAKRGDEDRFEKEQDEFFARVQQTYLQLANKHPQRYGLVDADQSVDEVASAVQKILKDRFAKLLV